MLSTKLHSKYRETRLPLAIGKRKREDEESARVQLDNAKRIVLKATQEAERLTKRRATKAQ